MQEGFDFTVESMGRETRQGYRLSAGGPLLDGGSGFAAVVTVEGAGTLHLSRLDDETEWVADAYFRENGAPVWCHSFGERAGLSLKAASDDVAAALNAHAATVLDAS